MSLAIAKTILSQLGGNKFVAMTGAKSFVGSENGLTFRIPRANGVVLVNVTLDVNDLYRVTFYNSRGTILATKADVFADKLPEVFTNETGLHTSI